MISDIIKDTTQNTTEGKFKALDSMLGKAQEVNSQILSAKEAMAKPKPSAGEYAGAFVMDNITGAQSAKYFVENMGVADVSSILEAEDYTNTFIAEQEAAKTPLDKTRREEMLRVSGVKPEDRADFDNITTEEDMAKALNFHNNKVEAERMISDLPIGYQLAGGLFASVIDPLSWAVGGGVGKVFKAADLAGKFTGATATALKTLENVAIVGTSVGASEYLLQQETFNTDPERLQDSITYSAALGLGVSLLPSVVGTAGSMVQQAYASNGVQKAVMPVKSWAQEHLVFNPIDQVLGSSTAPTWAKELVTKAGTSVVSTVKGVVDTAIGYKTTITDKHAQDVAIAQEAKARETGKTRGQIDLEDTAAYREFNQKVQNEADDAWIKMSQQERYALYEKETGQPIVGKEPKDLYQVVSNGIKKELEASGVLPIPKDLEYMHKFFKAFADEGTALKARGISGKTSYGYLSRQYNITEITKGNRPEVVQHFKEMLLNHKVTQHELANTKNKKKFLKAINEEAEALVAKAEKSDLHARYLDKDSVSGLPKSSLLRSINLDETLYPQYFTKSFNELSTGYADSMGGKLAMKKYFDMETVADNGGVRSLSTQIEDMVKKVVDDGGTTKDAANLRAILESVAGTRKIAKDPNDIINYGTRIARGVATAMYNTGFAMYSLAEVGAIIAKHGIGNTIREFIPAHKHMYNLVKSLGKNDPMVGYMNDMALAGMWLRDLKHTRFETESLTPHRSMGEQALDEVNHLGRKITFFNHLQDTLDFMAGGAFLNKTRELATRLKNGGSLTAGELSQYNRYGLTPDDIVKMADGDIKYHKGGKMVSDYNFYGWADQDAAHKILLGMRNAVHDTIVRTDGTKVHRFQSEASGMKQLLSQYTHFPTVAYERLLLAGMREAPARTVAGTIASTAIMYCMLELQDAALVASGVKDVEASSEDIAVKAFMRTPFVGLLPNIYDMFAQAAAVSTTGGFTPSKGQLPTTPGLSTVGRVVTDALQLPQLIASGDYEGALAKVGKNTPLIDHLPFFNAGWKALTKQTIKERGSNDMRGVLSREALAGSPQETMFEKYFKE